MPGIYPELPTRVRPPEAPPFADGSMTHPIAANPLACGAIVGTIFDDVCVLEVVETVMEVLVVDVCAMLVVGTTVTVLVVDVCALVVVGIMVTVLVVDVCALVVVGTMVAVLVVDVCAMMEVEELPLPVLLLLD